MKILIAVADQSFAATYRHTLGRARRHDLTVCTSRGEALQAFRQGKFDAAIVQGDFPDGQGIGLVASLRHRASADFTVIGLPTTAVEKLRGERIQAGATAVLGPEFDLFDLLKALGLNFVEPSSSKS